MFDRGTDWYTILSQLDPATKDQQFSADIVAAAVLDIYPWNESKKPSAPTMNHPGFHAPSGFCDPAGRSVTCWE